MRTFLPLWVALPLLFFFARAHSHTDHPYTATLDKAYVSISMSDENPRAGDEGEFTVPVLPREDAVLPVRVRARLGMPMMFHWTTEESGQTFHTQQALTFPAAFPMYGKYRFRVWIDYPDGHTDKTALDFMLDGESAPEPVIAE